MCYHVNAFIKIMAIIITLFEAYKHIEAIINSKQGLVNASVKIT